MNTTCAACAKQLEHDAPRCGRCETKYCGKACQHDHWRRGHKQICKKIHRGGGAEQYHADKKYKEAVAVAVEKCADDTKGQTCYICTEAVHWKSKEGLVRGCACRGTAGFAHVSCLAEQANILVAGAEENNLDQKAANELQRFSYCHLCEQEYHGVVRHALGWACWKTNLRRPEGDLLRELAMDALGRSLFFVDKVEEGISVYEARLSLMRRTGAPAREIRAVQCNLATAYQLRPEAQCTPEETYTRILWNFGPSHSITLRAAMSYTVSLIELQRFEEAKSLLLNTIPVAQRVLGESHQFTLMMRWNYARTFYKNLGATLDDLREAVTTLEETASTMRRIFGGAHPNVEAIEASLYNSRWALIEREIVLRGRANEPKI